MPEKNGELAFFNGYGGFDGNEYVIRLSGEENTPLPWANVVANERFGFVATESGGGYTWAENSREFKLTQWSNDTVADPQGEAVAVLDSSDRTLTGPTLAPYRDSGEYEIRYGFGYCRYSHARGGLRMELTQFVPVGDSVKLSLLTLTNETEKERRLTVYYHVNPILGAQRSNTLPYIVTEMEGGILTAQNTYNGEYSGLLLFLGATEPFEQIQPGSSLKIAVTLPARETKKICLKLGCGRGMEQIGRLCGKYDDWKQIEQAFFGVQRYWDSLTRAVTVQTPDESMNLMLNGWLLYQTLSCRMLARSAFYQSGGAYGYRDQLQDSLAFLHVESGITRRQILLHAAHQFLQGDVQHWWHENPKPEGDMADKGIRTRFSDDLLWLPYVLCRYLETTGDETILEEKAPYLEGDVLAEGEDERYFVARLSGQEGSVYEHAKRALERSLTRGPHGMPLMGSGDWNDGMNTVGNQGRGESVWLGWFLCDIIGRFAPVCEARGDTAFAKTILEYRVQLTDALNREAWDGAWFRRAYFDDGTPMGSSENTECKIDSIAQSWAVLSGCAEPEKAGRALESLGQHLVDEKNGIIKLLTPPFGEGNLSPGYIKSYVMGVRENGGQYTHAAVWAVMAVAAEGRGSEAVRLYHMLNPINHALSKEAADVYKTEPYAVAADVYSAPPHEGRGGWSWYTGAAGWMYQCGLESILGLQRRGEVLVLEPHISREWKEYSVDYQYGNSLYHIAVQNESGAESGIQSLHLDGNPVEGGVVPLTDDGKTHTVLAMM